MKISFPHRHALTVADSDISHKIDYVAFFKEILNPEGHSNRITGSIVTAILLKCGFFPLMELHRKGSAPAACAAGLFSLTRLSGPSLSSSRDVRVFIYLFYLIIFCPLFMQFFFEASYWPSGNMISLRPLIGPMIT